jgi:hypothetical protein
VLALALAEWVEGNKGLCRKITSDDASKKTSFNTKTLTLNLANLELGEGFRDFPFILFQSSFYLFIFFENFYFMTCSNGKQKLAVEKE